MNQPNTSLIQPYSFELYTGCMKSGKSRRLIERVDKLSYVPECSILAVKPAIDKRDRRIHSRFGHLEFECHALDNPSEILSKTTPETQVIAIDEINLFGKGIYEVVKVLVENGKHVLGAGLDTDFRGEPFGEMPKLLSLATYVEKLYGVCEYEGCGAIATRTQRLIDGKPAHYTSPTVMIEGDAEYQCRCVRHHEVPKD